MCYKFQNISSYPTWYTDCYVTNRPTVSWYFAVLRQLRTVRRQAPTSVLQLLIVALVLSWLDYCSSMLFGLPANLIQRLQSVQNAAARLIFRIWRSGHITPALISLHWLCIPERIFFKLSVMTYRPIHGMSPSYLHSCFTRVADMTSRRRLRCSTSHRLDVPPVRLSTVGKRAFPVSGATVWNDLPARRICVVTRGLQTTTRDLSVFMFLPRHYHMTHVLPFITTVWTPVVLAIINNRR